MDDRVKGPLLNVRGLSVEFPTRAATVRAVRDVSVSVEAGEVLGLVGESGSGKSVLLRSLLGLVPPPGRVVSGEVRFAGRDLLRLNERELRTIRGGEVALISQDPVNAFNPALRIGFQLIRAAKLHRRARPAFGWERNAEQMLNRVGINVTGKLKQYPFELSQGQLQRVMTAMATMSGQPRLLLADEPTTSLDVTIEAQILWLLTKLQKEIGMAVIFVSHDLGVIAQVADRVAVMYAGTIVEQAPIQELFAQPSHPYTIGLLRSSRGLREAGSKRLLYCLPGAPPDLTIEPTSCSFAPRCAWATDVCRSVSPRLRQFGRDALVACHHAERVRDEGNAE